MKRTVLCVSLLCSVTLAGNAFACGDKMIQVGRGVRYQRAMAVRPATIVMVVGQHERDEVRRLRSELTQVGHTVEVVGDTTILPSLLREKHVDIVMSDNENLAAVSEQVDAAISRPRIVVLGDRVARSSPAGDQRQFPLVLLSSRALEQVAVVNSALK